MRDNYHENTKQWKKIFFLFNWYAFYLRWVLDFLLWKAPIFHIPIRLWHTLARFACGKFDHNLNHEWICYWLLENALTLQK